MKKRPDPDPPRQVLPLSVDRDAFLQFIDSLHLLPSVLIPFIFEYFKAISWKGLKLFHANTQEFPLAIVSDSKSLFCCTTTNNIYQYSLPNLQLLDTRPSSYATGLDLIEKELYILEKKQVQIFDIKSNTAIRSWLLFSTGDHYGIKVYKDEAFISGWDESQIFVYICSSGVLSRTYGKRGSGIGEFYYPVGITVDEDYLYICDRNHHRIQVLTREDGFFSYQFGSQGSNENQFSLPYAIYLSVMEDLLYIGDSHGVKIFTKEGKFLQRVGSRATRNNIYYVGGIVIQSDRLYVGDYENRIEVWT